SVVGDALSIKEKVKSRRVLLVGSVIDEAHTSRYLVHSGADKRYYNLGDMYWESCVEKDIATYADQVSSFSSYTRRFQDVKLARIYIDEIIAKNEILVVLVKEKPKAVRDRQKSYVDYRRKPLEFEVRLPKELNSVHDTFHVSNLKKCLANANFHMPLDEIRVDNTLCFVKEPVEIMDREIMDRDIKKLKRRNIALVKVRWNSKCGLEFTWEHEDQMRIKYPQLFMDRVVNPDS
ncbi:hypothetical protein Tco_0959251, partial [Tanacetum coccineum]